ncbi:MAG TPA: hypothetical protein VEJ47_13125 [Candidatus Eremiobacteraceae bacterium]|nr:hypothetical protein [Candidatus Eremiobacteraceae bacterium]
MIGALQAEEASLLAKVAGAAEPNTGQGDARLGSQTTNNRFKNIGGPVLTGNLSGKGEQGFGAQSETPSRGGFYTLRMREYIPREQALGESFFGERGDR